MPVPPIPEGYRTITPHLTISPAAEAVEFYKKAFGAVEVSRMPGPGGKLMHAAVRIGDSMLMMNDEFPEMGPCPVKSPRSAGTATGAMHLYVEDTDAAFARATGAGATTFMPPMDMPWGDRYCMIVDPFGVVWSIGTRKEILTPEQISDRMRNMGSCEPKP